MLAAAAAILEEVDLLDVGPLVVEPDPSVCLFLASEQ